MRNLCKFALILFIAALCIINNTLTANAEFFRQGEKYTYKITWQGETAGYSRFIIAKRLSLAGEVFYKTESVSELKIGLGKIDHLQFDAQMEIRARDLKPTFFACRQIQDGNELQLDCLISPTLIAQKNSIGQNSNDTIITLSRNTLPQIYMNNLWGRVDTLAEHYWLLLNAGKSGKTYVYDPVLQYKGDMIIEAGKYENIKVDGKLYQARLFKIKDLKGIHIFNAWVEDNGKVVKIQEPGGGLEFELTSKDMPSELKKIAGVDMWKNTVSRANMFIANPGKVKNMKIELELAGRGIMTDEIVTPGFKQTFENLNPETGTKGVFSIETSEPEVKGANKFPVSTEFNEEMLKYLKSEVGIESNDDLIHNKALEATWKAQDTWEASKKIMTWIDKNIPTGIALPSAKMTIVNNQGNSESKALLAIAMCRSVNIPARRVGGIVFSAGNFIPHWWIEVYTGESGWIQIDPSAGEAGMLGATHVRLFNDGDIWAIKANVIDFDPKPPSRVTYINREVVWPVGEERTYTIIKKGYKVGDETAKMEEIAIVGDSEAYRMSFISKAINEGTDTESANYWMNPQGLPIKFLKVIKKGEIEDIFTYILKDKILSREIKDARGESKTEIPISKGVYFADNSFLSQWALVAGQFPEPGIGKTCTFSIFDPETLSIETYNAIIKKFEPVEAGDQIYDAFVIETDKGVTFWLDKKTNRIVKITFKEQEIDIELNSAIFKM